MDFLGTDSGNTNNTKNSNGYSTTDNNAQPTQSLSENDDETAENDESADPDKEEGPEQTDGPDAADAKRVPGSYRGRGRGRGRGGYLLRVHVVLVAVPIEAAVVHKTRNEVAAVSHVRTNTNVDPSQWLVADRTYNKRL